MYFYFSCDYPAALKLNGGYLGVISKSVKACDIDLSLPTLVEVCPLSDGYLPINFMLDENFNGELDGCLITDLRGGYLIKFNGEKRDGEFNVLAQEKFSDACVTVFRDNGLKVSIETNRDFFADNLSAPCNVAEIKLFELDGESLCAVICKAETTAVFVYALNGKIIKVFERQVDGVSFENGFSTIERFLDMAKHEVACDWKFDGGLKEKNRQVKMAEYFDAERLPQVLKPFAFLEEYLVGGDVLPYLTGGVKENADKLNGFFGEVLGVMPPPVFREIEQVGLIYAKTKNRYYVDYFTFEFDDGKICNIKKCDT